DPPQRNPFYASIHPDLFPPDALAHACELLRGVSSTLEAHCRVHTGEPGTPIVANAAHCTDTALALIEHVFDCCNGEGVVR
ncbi:hypothetical protein, partial [Pseudomonas reidholzensis]